MLTRSLNLAGGQPVRLAVPLRRGAAGLVLRVDWQASGRGPAYGRQRLLRMTTYHAYNLVWRRPDGPTPPPGPALPSDR